MTRNPKLLAYGAAVVLSLSAVAAQAAVCPPPPNTGARIFTIDAPVQAIGGPAGNNECYDHGTGNVTNGGGGVNSSYGTDTGTSAGTGLGGNPDYTDKVASVPLGFRLLDSTDQGGPFPNLLTVTGIPNSPGTITISLPSLEGYMVLFKSGGGTLNPDWASFVLTPGYFGTFNWSLSDQGLSHVELWGKTVVPIPAAAWLLGSGLLGLLAVGRRRKGAQIAAA